MFVLIELFAKTSILLSHVLKLLLHVLGRLKYNTNVNANNRQRMQEQTKYLLERQRLEDWKCFTVSQKK